jgi:excisionase family DNA binding protein
MFQFSPGRSRAREQAHWVTEGSAALVMRTSTGEERSLDADLMEAIFWLMTNVDQSASVVVAGADDRVSPSEAAKMLGVSRPFVMNLVEEGQLPDFPVGTHHRIPITSVLALRDAKTDAGYRAMAVLQAAGDDPVAAERVAVARARAQKRMAGRAAS